MMKVILAMALTVSSFSGAIASEKNDQMSAAIDAAIVKVTEAGEMEHCASRPLELVRKNSTYTMLLACVGEAGSRVFSVDVQYANESTNSNPRIAVQSQD